MQDLFNLTRAHAENTPFRLAVADDTQRWSWAQLDAEGARWAAALAAHGVRAGDRVALWSDNRIEHWALLVACARLRAIFAPLHTRATPAVLAPLLDALAPRVVLVEPARAIQARSAWAGALMTLDAPLPPAHEAQGSGASDEDHDVMILHTSGTTGRARGAVLSASALAANARQFVATLGLEADDVSYAVAPLHHVAGLNVLTTPLMWVGGASWCDARFDASRALEVFARGQVSCAFMVPTMWQAIVDHPDFARASLGRLRLGVVGGAACPPRVRQALAARGVELTIGYGLTEAGPMVSTLRGALDAPAGALGWPAPEVSVRLSAQQELEVRAPNLMRGYWRDAEATAAAMTADGWLRTGDLAREDPRFGLMLTGRLADRIVTGGENVYPQPIEAALMTHPLVREAHVFGTPHPVWGEVVTALIRAEPDAQIALDALRAHTADALGDYEQPRRLICLSDDEAIPLGPTLKPSRRALASAWAAGRWHDRAEDRDARR